MSNKKFCIDCKFKEIPITEEPCNLCMEHAVMLGWHYYWEPRINKEEKDPFSPHFDHSKCYFWCGNPYCHSNPSKDNGFDTYEEDEP